MITKNIVITTIIASILVISYLSIDKLSNNLTVRDSGKVKIDIYTQSLCPDCIDFTTSSLKNAINTKDFWKICDLNIYPYGNTKYRINWSGYVYICQHGAKQCQGNLIQTCALSKADNYNTQGVPFVVCLQQDTSDFLVQGQKCASKYGLNWGEIKSCAEGYEGSNLMYDMAMATYSLNPSHTYVPWIVVNNNHSTSSQGAVISNLVKYVCSIYTGPQKIEACN